MVYWKNINPEWDPFSVTTETPDHIKDYIAYKLELPKFSSSSVRADFPELELEPVRDSQPGPNLELNCGSQFEPGSN